LLCKKDVCDNGVRSVHARGKKINLCDDGVNRCRNKSFLALVAAMPLQLSDPASVNFISLTSSFAQIKNNMCGAVHELLWWHLTALA